MKYIIAILSVVFLFGCATTKTLKTQNKDLTTQNASLKDKVSQLTSQKATLETSGKKCSNDLKACNTELKNVKSYYGSYKEKLTKIKSELLAAFPNNLNEVNFSIKEEDGRLIVSIPNKILYARGSADFSTSADQVIQKLSTVFKNNKDLQILIEGHTDDTPLIRGSKYKDNWDLSVARAVNVVRKFETYGVNPQRLTAAGRGYFAPISTLSTEEARAMNRRTEIIIRPKISELLKMMSQID